MKKNIFAVWTAAAMLSGAVAWGQGMAPVNPAFARWQREKAAKAVKGGETPSAKPRGARSPAARGEAGGEEMDFGFVPTVLDMGYLSNLNDNMTQGVGDALPSSFDLRESGAVTGVKDQGSWGNCWAFAALGSLESWVKKSEGTELDLSENHLANRHGWNSGFGGGGNAQMAEGYLLRWAGPVAESEDGYPRPGQSAAGTVLRHSQRVRWIPGRTGYLDNDGIKSALMSWGALQADYYHANGYYNAKKASYYFNGGTSYRLSNHSVLLVGWDDGYSRKNFSPEPPGDGAFIARNSWGSGWGDGGYFRISYYDESFAWGALYSFSSAEPADNYDGVYQHDPLGMVGAIGYNGPTAWGANLFTATNASKIAAAGFYAMTPRTTYTLRIYTGCRANEPTSGTLAAEQSGTVDAAGYVTVPLPSPVAVSSGQRFSAVLQLSTPGHAYPLAVEYAVAGYSAAATAEAGESFLSANGSSWNDFTKRVNSTANFCCKVYVKAGTAAKKLQGIDIAGVNSLDAGASAAFSCTVRYSDGSSKAVTPRWSISEGSAWASVDAKGTVTAKATDTQRTVTLKAAYSEGGVSVSATWTLYVTVAAPGAPEGLTASEGTEESCVRLAWSASAGASSYAVYRGTKESSGKAGYLGTVTVPRYADTAAVPGVDYRYFVKAKNGSGSSAFSEGAWGWRALAAPTELAASDGAREDRVDVMWNRSEGAGHYRVWRAEGDDGFEPVSGWQTSCQFADTTADIGTVYTYTVTAAIDEEGTRESASAIPDEGFRTGPKTLKSLEISGPVSLGSGARGTYGCTAVYTDGTRTQATPRWSLEGGTLAVSGANAVVTAPVASENTTLSLTAEYTDGATRSARLAIMVTPAVPPAPSSLTLVSADENGIALRWGAVASASSYQLWRGADDEESSVVAATTATTYTDSTAVPAVAYTYRVAAANGAGAGAPGTATVTAVRPIAAPAGVSASYGTYADKVLVTWRASEGAAFYRVWRAESADGEKTALGDWQAGLAFEDATGTAGTVYFYSVQAAADAVGTAASAFGGPAAGLRKVAPKPLSLTVLGPDRVAAESSAAYSSKVRYDNGAVQTVVPVWYLAGGAAFASIGADGRLDVGALSADRTITVSARFTDGGTTVEGSLDVALIAPIVQTATVKDVEAHARWPWNGWVDVDYTLETAPSGTVAKVSLSGYDRDHQTALAATTLAGDGARGATVAAGERRISWNLGADYPDFHATEINVSLAAIPADPVDANLVNGGLAVAFFDVNTVCPYSIWRASYGEMWDYFATRSPTLATNTAYVGDSFAFGCSEPRYQTQYGDCIFPDKYADASTEYFAALFYGTIDIPTSGTYQFKALCDNGWALYIDQQLVFGILDTGISFSGGMTGNSVTLSSGLHSIEIAFHEITEQQGLVVYWQPPMADELTLLPQSVLYYTDPTAESVTVHFESNGGSGTMADWMCNPNFAAMLPANTFRRSGCTFVGWATSASGAVEYTDGQDVSGWDVAAGETVTLYAVWKEIEVGELPTKGLVAYYPFNGNLNDESGNGHHLTNHGGALAADRFGNANSSLSFDGQGHYANAEDNASCRMTNSFSVSCWFKTDVSKAAYGSASTYWNTGNYAYAPTHGGGNAGVGFKVGTDGLEIVEHGSCYMPTKLQYNAQIGSGWNQVCMVVENNTGVRLFLNGECVDSATLSTREKYCNLDQIGGLGWGYYTGLVDDFLFYNRALTDKEVQQIYLAGVADDGGDIGPVPPVGTGDWYVSALSGKDTNDGRSWASAKKSIQAAIDASSEGETIVVADGTYAPIMTDNKAITIRSVNGAGKTIIDGDGNGGCAWLTCVDRDTYGDGHWDTELIGFTLQNGYSSEYGGVYGGTLENCILTRNQDGYVGSGARISKLHNCLIVGNYGNGACHSWLYNCTVTDNSYGIWDCSSYNSIIWGNSIDSYISPGFTHCVQYRTCISSARYEEDECIHSEPLFVAAESGDYRLVVDSPCIDSGNNDYVETISDVAGNERIANGTVDIGCYEYGSGPVVSSLSDGLVSYWPFDGGARDASGNGNDGTVNGATLTNDRNGKANGAYHFEGYSTITVADSTSLRSPTKAISIAAWMKPSTVSDWVCLLCKGEDKRQYGLGFYDNECIMVNDYYGESRIDVVCHQSPGLESDVWKHIVATWDGKTIKVYADGVLVGSEAAEGAFAANDVQLYIGADYPDGDDYYEGDIDDLAIWNRALTAEEVARLYAGEKPVASERGLTVRYYDHQSSLSISDWASQVSTVSDCKAFYATLVPSLVTNSLDIGNTLDFGSTKGSFCHFHGKYATQGTEYFSIVLTGSIQLEESGTYVFSVYHDDGCVIYVDGKSVYAHAGGTSADQFRASSAELEAGRHEILIACHEYAGDQILRIRMKAPSDSEVSGLPQAILYQEYDELAKYLVVDLSGGPSAESWPVEYLDGEPAGGFNTDEYKTTKLVLRRIEPGTFMMGGEYQTTLTKPYYMGVFEVTQKQYELVTGEKPSYYKGDKRPVEYVSWNTIRGNSGTYNRPNSTAVDENSFMGRLRARTGLEFDLPTEAQWEYACRAGTTSDYNNGGNSTNDLKKLGRYYDNRNDGKGGYGEHTTVGSYQPNAWGLYDMHGNVYEWCLDWWGGLTDGVTDPVGPSSGSNRVGRGGSWDYNAYYCTSSYRNNYYPSYENRYYGYGFRLVRTLSK